MGAAASLCGDLFGRPTHTLLPLFQTILASSANSCQRPASSEDMLWFSGRPAAYCFGFRESSDGESIRVRHGRGLANALIMTLLTRGQKWPNEGISLDVRLGY